MADGEAEDLEYHVTFPTAISADTSDEACEEPASLDRKEPVVILLGWMGCEDRHLSKYSAIYHSLGFTTVRYMVPSEHLRSQPKLKEIAKKVLELVFDLGFEENVVFFHIFSNGGCLVYRYITRYLHDPVFGGGELTTIRVAGCIYDSAPCASTAQSMIRACDLADQTSGLLARLFRMLSILLAALLSFVLPAGFSSSNIFSDRRAFVGEMKADPARYPQLYLYSKTDDICDWRAVDDVVESRRKRQVNVQQVCWQESRHCAHLLAHRDDYISNCQDFVQGCLQNFVAED